MLALTQVKLKPTIFFCCSRHLNETGLTTRITSWSKTSAQQVSLKMNFTKLTSSQQVSLDMDDSYGTSSQQVSLKMDDAKGTSSQQASLKIGQRHETSELKNLK